jgi:hypothetical protein
MALTQLYQEMSALTFAKCEKECMGHSFSCCSPEYCEMALRHASATGHPVPYTGHSRLPLMGERGCVVAPHLRRLCTIHICERILWGDPVFAEKYFELREEIEELEYAIYKKEKL